MTPDFSDVRFIYFDLDDTLCGYWDASKAGLRDAFREHGLDPESFVSHWAAAFRKFSPTLKKTGWYETYLSTAEPSRTELMRLTLLESGNEDAGLAARLSASYAHFRDGHLALFPEVRPTLELLATKYEMGLITNGPADVQRQEIETLAISPYFQNVFIEGEMRMGKPHPDVFRRAEAASGFVGPSLLFVGNSYAHDVAPAIAAGWRTAWVRRPSDVPPSSSAEQSRPEELPLDGLPPDVVLADLTGLLPALGFVGVPELVSRG